MLLLLLLLLVSCARLPGCLGPAFGSTVAEALGLSVAADPRLQ